VGAANPSFAGRKRHIIGLDASTAAESGLRSSPASRILTHASLWKFLASSSHMAFVPGYDHDVFVSYAHVDDEPWLESPSGAEKPPGWVATLVRHLRIALSRKIGRADAFKVWFDQMNLRGNLPTISVVAFSSSRCRRSTTTLSHHPNYQAVAITVSGILTVSDSRKPLRCRCRIRTSQCISGLSSMWHTTFMPSSR